MSAGQYGIFPLIICVNGRAAQNTKKTLTNAHQCFPPPNLYIVGYLPCINMGQAVFRTEQGAMKVNEMPSNRLQGFLSNNKLCLVRHNDRKVKLYKLIWQVKR